MWQQLLTKVITVPCCYYEDNGFTSVLNVPLTSRLSLTGSVNRSLRHRETLVDKAMRGAEQ